MNLPTFRDYSAKFWIFYALGTVRLWLGVQQGRIPLLLVPVVLTLALGLNYLFYLGWRASKKKSLSV